jgi:hypothetical protein
MDLTANENEKLNLEMRKPNEIKTQQQSENVAQESSDKEEKQDTSSNQNHSDNNDRDDDSNSYELDEKRNSDAHKGESDEVSGSNEDGDKKEKKKVNKNDAYSCANCLGEFSKQKMVRCYICKQLTCKVCESSDTHLTKRNDHSSYICKDCIASKHEKNR